MKREREVCDVWSGVWSEEYKAFRERKFVLRLKQRQDRKWSEGCSLVPVIFWLIWWTHASYVMLLHLLFLLPFFYFLIILFYDYILYIRKKTCMNWIYLTKQNYYMFQDSTRYINMLKDCVLKRIRISVDQVSPIKFSH